MTSVIHHLAMMGSSRTKSLSVDIAAEGGFDRGKASQYPYVLPGKIWHPIYYIILSQFSINNSDHLGTL